MVKATLREWRCWRWRVDRRADDPLAALSFVAGFGRGADRAESPGRNPVLHFSGRARPAPAAGGLICWLC